VPVRGCRRRPAQAGGSRPGRRVHDESGAIYQSNGLEDSSLRRCMTRPGGARSMDRRNAASAPHSDPPEHRLDDMTYMDHARSASPCVNVDSTLAEPLTRSPFHATSCVPAPGTSREPCGGGRRTFPPPHALLFRRAASPAPAGQTNEHPLRDRVVRLPGRIVRGTKLLMQATTSRASLRIGDGS
jgi:hypothetical protein